MKTYEICAVYEPEYVSMDVEFSTTEYGQVKAVATVEYQGDVELDEPLVLEVIADHEQDAVIDLVDELSGVYTWRWSVSEFETREVD